MGNVISIEQVDDKISEIQRMLKVWAHWLDQGGKSGCRGYPKASAFVHANEGDRSCSHAGQDNKEARRVDNALCLLKIFNYEVFLALRCEYDFKYSNREAANYLTHKNKRKITVTRFREMRSYGEYYIAGILFS